ncbi:hypothetical protein [Cellulosimicrobium cellulans]|uniref:Uncharacterized protein n=1 Tax=Cellulosimicrobium cellulans TaxID=1710 RepID=A0A4Y4DVW8_CELCE|nr:hypothetical protein [Cellulosimicrobium cellulans]GED09166.1 hypothetical protein CCE02nite_11650 [Cellulosimicrobium cellulans]
MRHRTRTTAPTAAAHLAAFTRRYLAERATGTPRALAHSRATLHALRAAPWATANPEVAETARVETARDAEAGR